MPDANLASSTGRIQAWTRARPRRRVLRGARGVRARVARLRARAERDFFQGLVHVVVSAYQRGRGRPVAAESQRQKALRRLAAFAPEHRGLDVALLLAQLDRAEPDPREHLVERDAQPPVAVEEEQQPEHDERRRLRRRARRRSGRAPTGRRASRARTRARRRRTRRRGRASRRRAGRRRGRSSPTTTRARGSRRAPCRCTAPRRPRTPRRAGTASPSRARAAAAPARRHAPATAARQEREADHDQHEARDLELRALVDRAADGRRAAPSSDEDDGEPEDERHAREHDAARDPALAEPRRPRRRRAPTGSPGRAAARTA